MDVLILYINAVIWIAILFYWWRKKANFVGLVILALYAAMAWVSCHLYQNPGPLDEFGEITIFPFIYLFLVIIPIITALFKIDYKSISVLKLPTLKLMNLICIYIIVCTIYQLIISLPDIQTGLSLMLIDSSNAVEAYLENNETNMYKKALGTLNIVGFVVSTGVNFSMLFFFLYLLYPKKNKLILIGLIISVITIPIMSLASGSREKVITNIIVFFFMFLLLRPFFSNKIRKVLNVGAVVVSCLMLVFFFIISLGRARGDSENLLSGFESYFGQSYIVFDNNCLYANGTREGNLVSPLINLALGGKTYSTAELRTKYASLGIDNGRFYTFVGDFVLDYGPFIAFIVLILLALFFHQKLRVKYTLKAGHIILCYILLKLLSGFYLHQFTGIGGNLLVLELAFFYFLFSDNNLLVSIRRNNNDE